MLNRFPDRHGPQPVWWMPTGPLAVLPLAAAGHHDQPGRSVIDRVVSSTTPTIRALTGLRGAPGVSRGALVVAVPDAPGHHPLPSVATEANEVVAAQAGRSTLLLGANATVERTTAAMVEHDRAHFACHAELDPADPSRSGLVLTDGVLTVRQLSGLDLARPDLAYLSACSTAFGGGELLDEAIHVSSALQLAGYRHVVATMWPVGDLAARRFARLTYQALAAGRSPAEAVHDAVRQVRASLPDRLTVWAAHVHSGL